MKKLIYLLTLSLLICMSCSTEETEIMPAPVQETNLFKLNEANLVKIDENIINNTYSRSSLNKEGFISYISSINESLFKYNVQLEKMELLRSDGVGAGTVYFHEVGNKQMLSDFVPNDPRNFIPGTTDVPYFVDDTELGTEGTKSMTDAQTLNAINSAMHTWETVNCSDGLNFLNLGLSTDYGYSNIGLVQWLVGQGGWNLLTPGTIAHMGIVDSAFFDAIGSGPNVIAVTFTWIWLDQEGGVPTDIDQNGKRDTFAKEIYYNRGRSFQDDPNDVPGNGYFDFETVVMHEVGHGLSQTHFGKAFEDGKGELHITPIALMNPWYTIAHRDITKTDKAGHCSNWSNWPNK